MHRRWQRGARPRPSARRAPSRPCTHRRSPTAPSQSPIARRPPSRPRTHRPSRTSSCRGRAAQTRRRAATSAPACPPPASAPRQPSSPSPVTACRASAHPPPRRRPPPPTNPPPARRSPRAPHLRRCRRRLRRGPTAASATCDGRAPSCHTPRAARPGNVSAPRRACGRGASRRRTRPRPSRQHPAPALHIVHPLTSVDRAVGAGERATAVALPQQPLPRVRAAVRIDALAVAAAALLLR